MKADLDLVGHHGENGLLFASCYGYHDIVKYLLKLGVDVNYTDEVRMAAKLCHTMENMVSSPFPLAIDGIYYIDN